MALNTSWVTPRTGNTAGYLFDRAVRVIKESPEVRAEMPIERRVRFGVPIDEELRRKVTRLKIVDAAEKLEDYDLERISAAIWDYDNG